MYFELVKAELGVGLPSSAGPRLRGLQLELWQQAEEVLLVVLAAVDAQARGPPQPSREPMAAIITGVVELAKLFQRLVTESWLRWEGLLLSSAGVGVAESIVDQAEVKKVNRLVQRQLKAPQLIEQLLAKLRFEGLRSLAQPRRYAVEAEELQMSFVGAM